MRAYDRDEYLDEYEEEDEYEDEEAGEEEYVEEDRHQPTQEELSYLELRERLKEKMRKESGSAVTSSSKKKSVSTKDNFGSFFGPSQPVIAQRVIQESKSLLENPELAAKVFKSNNAKIKSSSSSAAGGSKPRANCSAPKASTGVQKSQILKNRDYSFLLSDNAELPTPAKERTMQKVSGPTSDARSTKWPQKSMEPANRSGKKVEDSHGDKKLKPMGAHAQERKDPRKSAPVVRPNQGSVGTKKPIASTKVTGPGQLIVQKAAPSKIPVGRLEKKVSAPAAKIAAPHIRKPTTTNFQASVSKRPVVQKSGSQMSSKAQVVKEPPMSSSRDQQQMKPSLDRKLSRMEGDRNKKKRRWDDDDDYDTSDYRHYLRQLTGYNPSKFRDDDDDSDMEAGFDEIMKEESRSARVAKREDEEELRKILEEERREALRRKKRKNNLR